MRNAECTVSMVRFCILGSRSRYMDTNSPMGPAIKTRQPSSRACRTAAIITSVLPVPGPPATCSTRTVSSMSAALLTLVPVLMWSRTSCCSLDQRRAGGADTDLAVQKVGSSRPSRKAHSSRVEAWMRALNVEMRSAVSPLRIKSVSTIARRSPTFGWNCAGSAR